MADFGSEVVAVAQTFRDAAGQLDDLLRKVGWAAQDVLEGRSEIRLAESNAAPEALALEYAARMLAPSVFPTVLETLEEGGARLRGLLTKVVPIPAEAEPAPATVKTGAKVPRRKRK